MSTAAIRKRAESVLDKWTRERHKALRIEVERDLELLPLAREFQGKCDAIKKAALIKLNPIYDRMRTLEAEIGAELLAGVNEKSGAVDVSQIENAKAIAEVHVDSKRNIPAADFLAEIPEADRTPDFWECLQVYIGKAEKFLPESVMTKLTKLKRSYSVKVCLKSEIKKK